MTRKTSAVLAAAAAALVLVPIGPAVAGMGAWAEGDRARVRLIAEGLNAAGELSAGIEIVLPQGWKTYWRSPGDAGIEPLFDFSGSQNAGDVYVHFPTPRVDDDGYSITNVYKTRVVMPISVPVVDAGEPVHLSGDLKFGVCEIVCVADNVTVSLTVAPEQVDAEAAARLHVARGKLPGTPEPGVFGLVDVVRDGGTDKRPVYAFTAVVPDAEATHLFVDGPDGWYPSTPTLEARDGEEATYKVKFSTLGSDHPLHEASFTVILSSEAQSVEQVIRPE